MELVFEDRFKKIPIDTLVTADWNYKTEDEKLSKKLVENLKRNGQIENILVRKLPTGAYEVVNGNHRYHAMVALEATEVYCYDLGEITDQQAYRIAIETNETKFQTDSVKLGTLVSEITKEVALDELELTMPYDKKDLELMSDITSFDWDQYGDAKPDHDTTPEPVNTSESDPYTEVKYSIWTGVAHEFERVVRHIKKLCDCDDSTAFAVINSIVGNCDDSVLIEHVQEVRGES